MSSNFISYMSYHQFFLLSRVFTLLRADSSLHCSLFAAIHTSLLLFYYLLLLCQITDLRQNLKKAVLLKVHPLCFLICSCKSNILTFPPSIASVILTQLIWGNINCRCYSFHLAHMLLDSVKPPWHFWIWCFCTCKVKCWSPMLNIDQ